MGSVRRRGDSVRVFLEPAEVTLLVHLTSQTHALLSDADVTGPATDDAALEALVGMSLEAVEPPTDPALRRLLPDAYRDDADAAEEFRRLTDKDLRATKRGDLSQIVTDLTDKATPHRGGVRVELSDDDVAAWLPALTSIRLALGTRIDVTEDMEAERETLPVDSPRYAEIATYDWLSWLQDAMVRALTRD
jgi:hypothetical protein